MEEKTGKNSLAVPAAIVIAGAFIALAVFLTSRGNAPAVPSTGGQVAATAISLAPVSARDHILGDPNAQIKIVEFVDLECPYCKDFHTTLSRIIDTYGKDGRVAWIFRQFPITSRHKKAVAEATASECAATLGGNAKFWEYVDRVFKITPSNDGLDLALLPDIAEQIGIDRAAFEACQTSDRFEQRISDDTKDAVRSGGDGTPWTIIIDGRTGQHIPVGGAVPYANMQSVIDTLLGAS